MLLKYNTFCVETQEENTVINKNNCIINLVVVVSCGIFFSKLLKNYYNNKNNHHFKRFLLRGKGKVEIKTGLLALAHNPEKKAA